MSIWRWGEWIAEVPRSAQLTLGEGDTPLIPSRRIGPDAGLSGLFFKLEGSNPCGSFKDRFAAAAISLMTAAGQTECIATSSGNTGAALAAYSAAAGLRCRIAIVETAPLGKMKQMLACGAELFRVRGFGLDAETTTRTFAALQKLGSASRRALQVSSYIYSPLGMTGVETIAFELAEQMEGAVDRVVCPAGGGGLCLAAARGFARLVEQGRLPRSPAVDCVQPEGNNTMAGPLRDGAPHAQEVQCTTRISGLQVPNINDANLVIQECRPTGGTGHLVSDEAVWRTQRRLALEEGIFTEPAGAVALAGILQAAARGEIPPDARIACLVTGIGFKDEESVDRMIEGRPCPLIDVAELESEAGD